MPPANKIPPAAEQSKAKATIAEAAVESPMVHRVPEESFKRATHLIGAMRRLAEFCQKNDPALVASGICQNEVDEIRRLLATIASWLDRFEVELPSHKRLWGDAKTQRERAEVQDQAETKVA